MSSSKRIYLDNNSTTAAAPEVVDAMTRAFTAGYGNPASQHAEGRAARALLEEARETICRYLGAQVDEFRGDRLILTSGGTESNNLALRGISAQRRGQILVSAIEHPSVSRVVDDLARRGTPVLQIPVNSHGVLDLDALQQLLRVETSLVSVMLGNNETGVLQPIQEISAICELAEVPLHTDATQAVGKIAVDFRQLAVSALTFAAHKFHGPRGIGGLLIKNSVSIQADMFGGFQQSSLRPGTECVELALGMQKALELCCQDQQATTDALGQLRDRLESQLRQGWPDLVVLSDKVARLPQTLAIAFPGVDRQSLVMALDLAGIACSTGSACASGSSEVSPTLSAMGCPPPIVDSAIRLSVSRLNSMAEIDAAAESILSVVLRQKRVKTH
ncbi:MAG: cysteine desulfurase [Planctomycetales bacterium]|nr:cysteine desulfurase [Planctomycetales bacterium]